MENLIENLIETLNYQEQHLILRLPKTLAERAFPKPDGKISFVPFRQGAAIQVKGFRSIEKKALFRFWIKPHFVYCYYKPLD